MERNMRTQRGTFALSIAIISVVSTIAWAQAVPPDAAPIAAGPLRGAIPDFSGVWAHPYLTGFEPPASGPGPVRNRSRRPAMAIRHRATSVGRAACLTSSGISWFKSSSGLTTF
jgi:hypothetical protein